MFISDEEIAAMQDPTGEAAESIKPVTPEEWQQQQQEIVENDTPNPSEQPEDSVLSDLESDLLEWAASGDGATVATDFSDHEGAYKDPVTGSWCVPDHRVK